MYILSQIFSAVFLLDAKVWVAILLVPVILLSFIRTLKVMAVVSAVSVILYIAGIFCLLVYACQTIKTPVNLPSFVGFGSMPLAFGSIVFAFEAIGVVSALCFYIYFIYFADLLHTIKHTW